MIDGGPIFVKAAVNEGGGQRQFAVPVAVGVHRKCADNRADTIRGATLPSCSNKPSRTSTTSSGRRPAARRELDYTEQTSWLLFLKYLDGLEQEQARPRPSWRASATASSSTSPTAGRAWAAPKDKDGKLDHNKALTGDDLRDFVNSKLFPYLHGFKQRASGPNTIEYKIGEIFGEIKNKIQSGYNLREIIDHIDELRFRSQTEKHELSHLYEAKIKNMGNAGRNGGEYYTPRPLIRAMVQVVQPEDRRAHLRRRRRLGRLPVRGVRLPDASAGLTTERPARRCRSAPSTARRRSRSPTSSRS